MQPRVLIVGAGPVGLMTAIQTKLYDPSLSILVLEKHATYQRQHPLLLDPDSFEGTHPDQSFQELRHSLSHTIRTNELEDKLLAYAKTLGITIEYTPVTDCEALVNQYPSADILIGADGSHSIVHEQIFGHQYQRKKTLQYIAEIKYDVDGSTRPLHALTEESLTLNRAEHFVSEFVGKEKDGATPVSIRIFVDAYTHEKMKSATFQTPYHLADIDHHLDSHIASLNRTIQAWIRGRASMIGEKRIPNSERITVTNLPIYASSECVKQHKEKTWFLVGDAAFGVPYHSLNNGILCSTQLAKTIHASVNHLTMEPASSLASLSSSTEQEKTPEEHYAQYVQHLIKRENIVAEVKNIGVTSLQATAAVSQAIPLPSVASLETTSRKNKKASAKSGKLLSFSLFHRHSASHPKEEAQKKEHRSKMRKGGGATS